MNADCIYYFLNYFFFCFHTLLILFNSLGWIFPRTRKGNLVTLLFTAFSWFVLGIWFGWGYCFCTDWHWRVREHLGYHDMPNSYIQFLVQKITGITFSIKRVDAVTGIVFFTSLALSLVLNVRGYLRIKKKKSAG